ncbi:hypothetical protein ACFLTD_03340 [Elusimicrobiota bacterium]
MNIRTFFRLFLLFLLLTMFSQPIHAFTVEIVAPHINESTPAAMILNNALQDKILNIENEIKDFIGDYSDLPDLAPGFAYTGVYSSYAASQRFTVSNRLMITAGSIVSIHAPSSNPSYYSSDFSELLEDEEFQAGFAIAPLVVQAGINSDFIVPGLFLSLQYGQLDASGDIYDVKGKISSRTYGIRGSYSIIDKKNVVPSLFAWNGLTLNAGLIYHSISMNLNRSFKMFDEDTEFSYLTYTGTIHIDPRFSLDIRSSAYVIPVEIMSSANFLGINIAAGLGIDIYKCSSSIELNAQSNIDMEGPISPLISPGSFYLDYTSKNEHVSGPPIAKIMLDLGMAAGPILIDIPVTWHYPTGLSAGITTGIRL